MDHEKISTENTLEETRRNKKVGLEKEILKTTEVHREDMRSLPYGLQDSGNEDLAASSLDPQLVMS